MFFIGTVLANDPLDDTSHETAGDISYEKGRWEEALRNKAVKKTHRSQNRANISWQATRTAQDQATAAYLSNNHAWLNDRINAASYHRGKAEEHQKAANHYGTLAFNHSDEAKLHFNKAADHYSAYVIPTSLFVVHVERVIMKCGRRAPSTRSARSSSQS